MHKISGNYVGEIEDDTVFDKRMGNPGNIGNLGNPGNRGKLRVKDAEHIVEIA